MQKAIRTDEQYRRECEARVVLRMPLQQRRDFLAMVEKARGKDATDALKAEMTRQFAERKAR